MSDRPPYDVDEWLAENQAASTRPPFDPDKWLAEKADEEEKERRRWMTEKGLFDTQSGFKDTVNTTVRSMHDAWTGSLEGAQRAVSNVPEIIGKAVEGYQRMRHAGVDSEKTEEEKAAEIARIQENTAQIRPAAAASGPVGSAVVAGLDYLGKDADKLQERRQKVNAALPVDQDFAESIPGGVIAGVGQIASQIPLYITGMGLPASIGQMYDQGYQDAKQHGADEGTAAISGLGNVPGAALEFLADKLQLGPVLDLIKKGGSTGRSLAKRGAAAAGAAIAEGATEAAQQVQGNAVAAALYDEDRKLTEGAGQAAIVGGIVGGGVRGLAEGVDALASRQMPPAGPSAPQASAGGLDTGQNVPESIETLQAQQEQLREGRRPAMMFPAGSQEALSVPEGFARHENERGIFHFDPDQITAEKIDLLSSAGRENEILGLGSVSKPEAMARAAQGDALVSIVERDAAGNEVKGAVGNRSTAARTVAELEGSKTPGNLVSVENPEQTILGRLRADLEAQAKRDRERIQKETAERDARQAELRAKQEKFDETLTAARSLAEDPKADFPKLNAALTSLTSYAEDNSLGLRQDQRNQALAEIARIQPRAVAAKASFEATQAAATAAAQRAQKAQESSQAARIQADRQAVREQASQGIGADGRVDFARLSEQQLETRARAGDKRAERELMTRAERPTDNRESLMNALAAVRLPATDSGLGAELKLLREEMTPAQRRKLISQDRDSLDRTAEALRGRGFTQIQTPDDVITFAQRALRGEDIRAERSGQDQMGDVTYAANAPTKGQAAPRILTDDQVSRQWERLKGALGPVAKQFDLRMGLVSEILQEEGYTREAQLLREGKLGKISAATAPRIASRLTDLRAQKHFIVVAAEAAQREKAPGLVLHELAHPFYDTLPDSARDVLRQMHREEVTKKTGPLFKDGKLVTDIAIMAEQLPAARVAADPDLPVKEWFAERARRLNEAWLSGEMAIGDRPMIVRLARQFIEKLKEIWSQIRGVDTRDDLFEDTFRAWLASGTEANVIPQATAYAQRRKAQFATEQPEDGGMDYVNRELENLKEDQSDPAEVEARGRALDAHRSQLKEDQRKEAEEIQWSEGAQDMRHPAAVGPVEPGDAWASAPKMTPEELREEGDNLRKWFNDNPEASDAEKALLRARADALTRELDRRAAADAIDNAPRVTEVPKVDRKTALLQALAEGRRLQAEGRKTGNLTAEQQGMRMVKGATERLDEEFPGWDAKAKPSAKLTERRAEEARPEEDPEPSDSLPPREDPPPPVRPGVMAGVFGNTMHVPGAGQRAKTWIRETMIGFRSSIPELPTFPAFSKGSDRFIAQFGEQFYNRIREFYRTLNSGNDFVQKEAERQVASITDPLLKLGGDFPASDYRQLQKRQEQFRKLRAEGKPMPPGSLAELQALNAKLENHPYVLFNRFMVALDLDWRHKNLKDSAGNPIALPNGVNASELDAEINHLATAIEVHPQKVAIGKAVDAHLALVKRVADDLKGRELLATEHLSNPFYFPHVTLQVTQGDKTVERELRPERVRVGVEADFRGYLMDPVGSKKPIETDYVRAMYFHLVQVGAHNLKADAVRDHVRPYDIRAKVETRARQLAKQRGTSVSWEQAFHEEFEKDGYVMYGLDSRDAFPTVTVDRDKLARRLGVMLTSADLQQQLKELGLRGVTLRPEDLTETLIQGQKEVWIVPARVAEALRGIADRQQYKDRAIEAALKKANSWWKQWKLFTPQNHTRYEYGNIVADLEKLWSASPGTFRHIGQAAKEMRGFFNGEAPSPELQSAIKGGVVNAITAQEVNHLQRLRSFEKFQTAGERILGQVKRRSSSIVFQPITNLFGMGDLSSVELSAWREGVTRYANYLANLKAIQNGARPDYAGAYWKDIEAIGDSSPGASDRAQRQAAQISKATFGDYGDISAGGQYLRDKLIPFYSWMEVNFKYHANLFRNLRDLVKDERMTKGRATASGARAIGSFAVGAGARAAGAFILRLALPYAAIALWNETMHADVEDELSEEDRRRVHITLGRDGEGNPLVIYANTALADVMKWFSGPKFIQAAGGVISGRTDMATAVGSWMSDIGPDLVNNTVGSFGPTIKIPATIVTGKNFFPDVLEARSIPSYDLRRNIVGQMTDEFTADIVERVAGKDYLASKDLGDWAKQLILQVRKRDPEQWAYYSVRDRAEAFLEERTGRKSGDFSSESPDQQVLRNFRRSIYQGNVENAVRFYNRLLDYGYTAERFAASIRSQDPLSTLPKKDGARQAFVDSLDEVGREELRRAYTYASRLTGARGSEKLLFPSAKGGAAALERFRQNPRSDRLEEIIQRQEGRSDPELMRQFEQDLARSLKVGR